jgi:hypothetical protein
MVAYQSGSLNQPIIYAILAVLVAVAYGRWDDIEARFFGAPRSLMDEAATCGDFQSATPADQASFLEDCDCLETTTDNRAVTMFPPERIEVCVREAAVNCRYDASLHQIYRTCFAISATILDGADKKMSPP